MNEPYQQEEEIFDAACLLPPEERASYLDQACRGNRELRQSVEALLKSHDHTCGVLERAGAGQSLLLSVPPSEKPGDQIGHYKLLQKIGEGGCGVVYMTEQEAPVRRRVALKIIKLGMDTKQVIARFEAERQALAMMEHPNIAKVLDAGATETGRPYFVMELVRGVRITDYCDEHKLSTEERLKLLVRVCQAVQHAHQKGVIHRDLKPSNILVTTNDGVPVPKVIDFGIAKSTQGRLTDQTLFTAFEQFMGTPAYMSPEQAVMTSLDIDTRTDIYSLGVLLYELLTGRTPFDQKELLAAGLNEMRRTIREKEPARPSTRLNSMANEVLTTTAQQRRTDVPRLIHLLRGDLDWIVMKALDKDRARRYETANGLAVDIQRHLNNEPVVARPPSRLYRFQKAYQRNRLAFSAGLAVVLALAMGLGLAAAGWRQTRVERDKARQAQQETETARKGEETQRREAQSAQKLAENESRKFQSRSYVADMDLANRALLESDLGTAQGLLRRYWPASHEPDLRNWEWRYLARLSDGDPHFSLVEHSSAVLSLCFVDENTLLTAGQADWRTVLWNAKERRPSNIITNRGFAGGVSEVMAVAPRRNAMFYRPAWLRSSAVTVVDLEKGTEDDLRDAKGASVYAEAPVRSLDISPDQRVLAVACAKQVDLWDLDEKTWLRPFETESGEATQGLFSPDGNRLVIADNSGHIVFWNLAERRKLGVLTNVLGSRGFLRFSTDGRWLVNPGGKSPTQIWRVEDLSLVGELSDSVFVERAVFSADGRWLATVGGDPTVRLWEKESSGWRKTRTFRGHTDPITAVAFSPKWQFLATGARNGEVKLWSLEEPPTAPEQVSMPAAEFFKLAGDGSSFGRILQKGPSNEVASLTAEIWSAAPLQLAFTAPLPSGPPSSAVVLAGSQGLVLGGYDGSIRVVGPLVGEEIVVTNAHHGEVYLMDASSDGSTLATKGIEEDHVSIWRLPRLEPIAELPRADNVHGVKLSDDGTLLAGFTGPGEVGVWDIPSMEGPPMWRGLAALQEARECAFSPDSRWLAAVTYDGGAFLWDLATHHRTVLPRALTAYNSVSFSLDGSRLAAGSEGESKLFDTASGQVVLSFTFPGLQLAFARDGENLLAVHPEGASVFNAPALDKLQFVWLKEAPSGEAPAYLGANPNYARPDRP